MITAHVERYDTTKGQPHLVRESDYTAKTWSEVRHWLDRLSTQYDVIGDLSSGLIVCRDESQRLVIAFSGPK